VHDYFDILGVARDARPNEIRRACCRRARATHPDVWDGDSSQGPAHPHFRAFDRPLLAHDLGDAAIDFVDPATVVDAMRAAFFATAPVARS